jgi:thioredoxin-like negative regulator of GroEL
MTSSFMASAYPFSLGTHPEFAGPATDLVDRAGTTSVAPHLALARAHTALSRDDLGEIVSVLEPRLDIDGLSGSRGEALGAAPMLVEALVAVGRGRDAAELVHRLGGMEDADARTSALVARCWGLVAAADDDAVAAFEAAISAHAQASDAPYELARTELLLGARLRRAGRRAEPPRHPAPSARAVRLDGPHAVERSLHP